MYIAELVVGVIEMLKCVSCKMYRKTEIVTENQSLAVCQSKIRSFMIYI